MLAVKGEGMKSFLYGHDRGVRICLRCHSWFLSEGAHTRFCTLCCAATEATEALPWQLQRSNGSSPLATTVATQEEVSEAVA
jgi:hypothetical protein